MNRCCLGRLGFFFLGENRVYTCFLMLYFLVMVVA